MARVARRRRRTLRVVAQSGSRAPSASFPGPTTSPGGCSPAPSARRCTSSAAAAAGSPTSTGNEYIDFVMAFGAFLLGYADPEVDAAAREELERGSLLSMNRPQHVLLRRGSGRALRHGRHGRAAEDGERSDDRRASHRAARNRPTPCRACRLSRVARLVSAARPVRSLPASTRRCSSSTATPRTRSRRSSTRTLARSRPSSSPPRWSCRRGARSSRRIQDATHRHGALFVLDEVKTAFRTRARVRPGPPRAEARPHDREQGAEQRLARCGGARPARRHEQCRRHAPLGDLSRRHRGDGRRARDAAHRRRARRRRPRLGPRRAADRRPERHRARPRRARAELRRAVPADAVPEVRSPAPPRRTTRCGPRSSRRCSSAACSCILATCGSSATPTRLPTSTPRSSTRAAR